MSGDRHGIPGRQAAKTASRAARAERLAQALRDNLRRRKDQARARSKPAVEPAKAERGGPA
jgi:hypothetical protein